MKKLKKSTIKRQTASFEKIEGFCQFKQLTLAQLYSFVQNNSLQTINQEFLANFKNSKNFLAQIRNYLSWINYNQQNHPKYQRNAQIDSNIQYWINEFAKNNPPRPNVWNKNISSIYPFNLMLLTNGFNGIHQINTINEEVIINPNKIPKEKAFIGYHYFVNQLIKDYLDNNGYYSTIIMQLMNTIANYFNSNYWNENFSNQEFKIAFSVYLTKDGDLSWFRWFRIAFSSNFDDLVIKLSELLYGENIEESFEKYFEKEFEEDKTKIRVNTIIPIVCLKSNNDFDPFKERKKAIYICYK